MSSCGLGWTGEDHSNNEFQQAMYSTSRQLVKGIGAVVRISNPEITLV